MARTKKPAPAPTVVEFGQIIEAERGLAAATVTVGKLSTAYIRQQMAAFETTSGAARDKSGGTACSDALKAAIVEAIRAAGVKLEKDASFNAACKAAGVRAGTWRAYMAGVALCYAIPGALWTPASHGGKHADADGKPLKVEAAAPAPAAPASTAPEEGEEPEEAEEAAPLTGPTPEQMAAALAAVNRDVARKQMFCDWVKAHGWN